VGLWAKDFVASNLRVLVGFSIATLVSIPFGIGIGIAPRINALCAPIMDMLRYVPVPALLPLCILWFGVDEAQKISVVVLGTVFQLTIAVAFTIQNVPLGYIETGLTLGLSRWKVLTNIVFPAAAPTIYDAIRVSFGWAWSYLVVAEIVGSSGIGYRLMASQRYLQTGLVFGGIAELAALGWGADWVFQRLRGVLLPWIR
jgi:NitT/TauT family transport system permease protein